MLLWVEVRSREEWKWVSLRNYVKAETSSQIMKSFQFTAEITDGGVHEETKDREWKEGVKGKIGYGGKA